MNLPERRLVLVLVVVVLFVLVVAFNYWVSTLAYGAKPLVNYPAFPSPSI